MRGMGDLLRQAQMMQKKMSKMQEDMAGKVFESSVGGGVVAVKVNGNQEVLSVVIDKAAAEAAAESGDVEMLQDMVVSAVNDALKKAKDAASTEMNQITGGMKIPGMF